MAIHNAFGKIGEDLATNFLIEKGYIILDRNWHYGHKEIDIIAKLKDEIIIVEVKSRKNNLYGNPEDAVDYKKIERIINSAEAYIKLNDISSNIRFDIITIIGNKYPFHIEHIIDAFHI